MYSHIYNMKMVGTKCSDFFPVHLAEVVVVACGFFKRNVIVNCIGTDAIILFAIHLHHTTSTNPFTVGKIDIGSLKGISLVHSPFVNVYIAIMCSVWCFFEYTKQRPAVRNEANEWIKATRSSTRKIATRARQHSVSQIYDLF